MSNARSIATAFIFLLIGTPGAWAEEDPAAGGKLAREWCSRCHTVEAGGAFKQHPPSFQSIAVYRSREQIFGRIMFPPLHAGMPEISYMLTPDNVDNIVGYIVSLETE